MKSIMYVGKVGDFKVWLNELVERVGGETTLAEYLAKEEVKA